MSDKISVVITTYKRDSLFKEERIFERSKCEPFA